MRLDERNSTVPLVDLTGATGHKTFTVEDGAILDVTRVLNPLPNNRYLLVSGLDPASNVTVGHITYLHPDSYTKAPVFENNNTELWLDELVIPDPFDPETAPPNLVESEDCASHWLNHTANGLALSPYEVLALRRDFHSGPPEAAASMALAGLEIHGTAVRAAQAGFRGRGVESAYQGPWRLWSNYLAANNRVRDRDQYSGYTINTSGFLFGAVWEASPLWALGGYAGYSKSDTEFRSLSADADSRAVHGGLQASFRHPSGFKATADGSLSRQSVDLARYPGHLGTNRGHFDQTAFGADLELAYDFQLPERTRLTPAVALAVDWMQQDAFAEKGPVMAATVDDLSGRCVESSLGATVEHDIITDGGLVTPGLGLNWKHRYTGRQLETAYAFVDNGNDYACTVKSREMGRDSLETSAYIDAAIDGLTADWSVRGGYTLEVGEKAVEHSFYAGIAVTF
jgi:outer membrane autotransporter protein